MSDDFKCFIGLHKYEVLEQKLIKNAYNAIIGDVYVCQCKNCGKLKEKVVYTDTTYKH